MSDSARPSEPGKDSDAAPPPVDLSGKVLGDFALLRRIGQGGMGQVYLAEQITLKRKVALKVLKPELAANETSLKRFRNEAQAVARATHANIVQVYGISEGDGLHYMALEYVDGFNLRDFISKKGPPELSLALSVMRQVASALARAAELGIIHRDVKPENILLTRKGEVKVADFGLSRCFGEDGQPVSLTQSGVSMGTPLYMSPEQVQGKPVDPRTDIYSFGVTCYHMLSGQPPFHGATAFEVAVQHVQNEATPLHTLRPDLPAELCAVVDRMMAKKPEDRFQTAREIIRVVARLRESLNVANAIQATPTISSTALPAPDATVPRGLTPPSKPRRRLWPLGLFAASVLASLLLGGIVAWRRGRLPVAETALTMSEEERLLRKAVEQPAPGDDPGRKTELALQARLNLGLYYLDHGRWADADRFFNRLVESPRASAESHELGQLGRALSLAGQDQARESTQALLECLKRLDGTAEKSSPLLQNPRVRIAIAWAVERNRLSYEANREPFPPELERLRRPGK